MERTPGPHNFYWDSYRYAVSRPIPNTQANSRTDWPGTPEPGAVIGIGGAGLSHPHNRGEADRVAPGISGHTSVA